MPFAERENCAGIMKIEQRKICIRRLLAVVMCAMISIIAGCYFKPA